MAGCAFSCIITGIAVIGTGLACIEFGICVVADGTDRLAG